MSPSFTLIMLILESTPSGALCLRCACALPAHFGMESASAVANLEFGIYPIKKCVGRQSNFGIESSYAVSGLVVDVLVTVAAVIAGAQLARVVLSLLVTVTLEKRQLGGKVRALESGLGCV